MEKQYKVNNIERQITIESFTNIRLYYKNSLAHANSDQNNLVNSNATTSN